MKRTPPKTKRTDTCFPFTTLFRSDGRRCRGGSRETRRQAASRRCRRRTRLWRQCRQALQARRQNGLRRGHCDRRRRNGQGHRQAQGLRDRDRNRSRTRQSAGSAEKIGRPADRDRVCAYVKIEGVSLSFKNKTITLIITHIRIKQSKNKEN